MSTGFDITSTSGSQSYSEALSESYKATQAYRVQGLTTKKTDLQRRQFFYNTLNSKLNTLVAQLDKFGTYNTAETGASFVKDSGIDEKFKTRSSTLTEKDYFTVSSSGEAIVGTNTMKIQRLAANDVLVSDRLTLSDNFSEPAGDKEFKIKINDKEFDVKVTLLGTETNQEAMTKIVNAINNIKDVDVSASLIKDTDTTGRISLVSKSTGEANKISFTESAVTKKLGWEETLFENTDNRTQMAAGKAGYKVSDANGLTAKFEINGIEITRNKNEIDDVLPGTTIKLLKVQQADSEAITITTDIDSSGVENLVDAFVKEFNGLLYYLNSNKDVQRSDPGMGTLQSRLRSIISNRMSNSEDDNAPKYISDIGYKINPDGTIVMKDKDKLKEYLSKEGGSQNVAEIFTSQTGFAARISEAIVTLKPRDGEIGLIKSRNESISSQLLNLDSRISTVQSNIDKQADSVRKEYESYLKVFLQAQGQYSLLSTMGGSSSGGYSSLLSQQYSS